MRLEACSVSATGVLVAVIFLAGCAENKVRSRIPGYDGPVIQGGTIYYPGEKTGKYVETPPKKGERIKIGVQANWYPVNPVPHQRIEVSFQQNHAYSLPVVAEAGKSRYSVFFDTNSSVVKDKYKEGVSYLEDILPGYLVSGHADIRGADDYNLVLSFKRARNVAKIMKSQGKRVVGVEAKGEFESFHVVPQDFQLDRRVDIIPVGE